MHRRKQQRPFGAEGGILNLNAEFKNIDPKEVSLPPRLPSGKTIDGNIYFNRAAKIWNDVERAKEILNKKTRAEINSILKEIVGMPTTHSVDGFFKGRSCRSLPVETLERYKKSGTSKKLKEKEWAEYFSVLVLALLDCWITRYLEAE